MFPGGKAGKPLSSMALLMLLRRMERGDLTAHGFRSTFRDWCAEATNYPREVAEAALAHTLRDKTEAAYQRGDLMEKRRRLMAEWAAFCARPAAEGEVVRFRTGANVLDILLRDKMSGYAKMVRPSKRPANPMPAAPRSRPTSPRSPDRTTSPEHDEWPPIPWKAISQLGGRPLCGTEGSLKHWCVLTKQLRQALIS